MAGANVFWVAEYARCGSKSAYHKHEFYQMVCPLSGELWVNDESIVKPGDVMLTKPEQYHTFPATPQYHNKEISLFDCKFTVTDPELHAALIQTPHCFTPDAYPLISKLIQAILSEARHKQPLYQKNIDSLFTTVLICIARQFAHSDNNAPLIGNISQSLGGGLAACKGVNAEQLSAYIDKNIENIATLDDLSDHMHINKSTLTDIFKKIFGMTPMRYVIHRRMEKAKELLLYSDLSISEISEKLGFSSIYYFSKAFKEREGLSPLSFRERHEDSFISLPHAKELAKLKTTYDL